MTHAEGTLLEERDAVAWLTIDRPDAGNALDLATTVSLRDAILRIIASEHRVLVLSGAGRFFCTGGDVAAIGSAELPSAYLAELASTLHEALVALEQSGVVTIAAVTGAAAGAGFGLALNADLVYCGPRARFLTAYGSVGLSPDAGVSRLLPEIVGPRRAAELALTPRALSGEEAMEWGIANAVLPDDDALWQLVEDTARQIAAAPPEVTARTKGLLRRRDGSFADHLAAEAASIAWLGGLAGSRELVAAFAARSRTTT